MEDNTHRMLSKSIHYERLKIENAELKAAVKMTDFSLEQLEFAYVAMKEALETATHALIRHELMGSDPEHDKVKFWVNQKENAELWMTQIYAARAEVKRQQLPSSN
jgi:hypothetical protein